MDRLRRHTAQAASEGAKLVVFPEAFVGGYPKGLDFGAKVGLRKPEGRDMFRRYWDAAVDVPGPRCDGLAEVAREHGVELVVGVIERDEGTLYCSVLFFGEDGSLRGKHRKLMPTAMERVVWGFGDGSTLPVLETRVGRVGAVICWENYMPLLRTAMYAKGVQIYCAPTVDDRDSWIPTMRHIAVEGRCFVLSCCQHARRSDFPEHYPTDFGDGPDTVLIRGGSCIVDPFGELVTEPTYGDDAVLVAELDLSRIPEGKYDLDVVGHYARPDVFTLTVDERPRKPVRAPGQD